MCLLKFLMSLSLASLAAAVWASFMQVHSSKTSLVAVDMLSQLLPSTMLVLAKKPDEAFKAPLNTKKQAPVTVTNTWGGGV